MLKLFDEYGKAFRQLSNNYFPIGFICSVRKNINKKWLLVISEKQE